jgi:hypothetical protein
MKHAEMNQGRESVEQDLMRFLKYVHTLPDAGTRKDSLQT